jgi:precorrin-6B methylase 2
MMGEITPGIAETVFGAHAKKLLLPLSQPHVVIVGMAQKNVNDLISHAIAVLKRSLLGSD